MLSNFDKKSKKKFEKLIDDWWSRLVPLIIMSQNKDLSKPVILVAISRKMPAIIRWIMSQPERFSDCEILNKCTIISDLAIPLNESDIRKSEVIIIDDIILSGKTIDCVSALIFAMKGEKPHILPMLRSNLHSEFAFADNTDLNVIETLSITDLMYYSSLISELTNFNHTANDIEFPTFSISVESKEKGKQLLSEICKKLDGTTLYKGDYEDELILIDTKHAWTRISCDFAKIRATVSDKEIRATIYAPCCIEVGIIDKLFTGTILESLWLNLINEVRNVNYKNIDLPLQYKYRAFELLEQLDHAKSLLLVTASNYIISAIVAKQVFSTIKITTFDLNCRDLEQIIGSNYSLTIRDIISNKDCDIDVSYSIEYPTGIPSFVCPSENQTEYITRKKNLFISGVSQNEQLSLIFNMQHAIYGLTSIQNIKVANWGETFESLVDSMSNFNESELDSYIVFVHSWVDSQISKGYIAPKYIDVTDSFGTRYFKRYFRSSIPCMPIVSAIQICFRTLLEYSAKKKSKLVKYIELENLLAFVFGYVLNESMVAVALSDYSVSRNELNQRAWINNKTQKSILDTLCELNILKKSVIGRDKYVTFIGDNKFMSTDLAQLSDNETRLLFSAIRLFSLDLFKNNGLLNYVDCVPDDLYLQQIKDIIKTIKNHIFSNLDSVLNHKFENSFAHSVILIISNFSALIINSSQTYIDDFQQVQNAIIKHDLSDLIKLNQYSQQRIELEKTAYNLYFSLVCFVYICILNKDNEIENCSSKLQNDYKVEISHLSEGFRSLNIEERRQSITNYFNYIESAL